MVMLHVVWALGSTALMHRSLLDATIALVCHHEVGVVRLKLGLAGIHWIGFGAREVGLSVRLGRRADRRRTRAYLGRLGLLQIEVVVGRGLPRVEELRVAAQRLQRYVLLLQRMVGGGRRIQCVRVTVTRRARLYGRQELLTGGMSAIRLSVST